MAHTTAHSGAVHDPGYETVDTTPNYADEHRTPFSSYIGIGIVVALLAAMMFLQASAATSLL